MRQSGAQPLLFMDTARLTPCLNACQRRRVTFRNDERQTICKFKRCRLNLRNLHSNLSEAQEFAVLELRGSKGSTNAAWKFKAPRKSSTESDSVFPNTPASIRLKTI